MGLLSLRILISALALACIVIAAAVCTVIAVTSGDSALDKTKDADAHGLKNCFTQGEDALAKTRQADNDAIQTCFGGASDAIMNRTSELLRSTADRVRESILATQDSQTKLILAMYDYIMVEKPLANTESNAFLDSMLRRMWVDFQLMRPTGVTMLQIVTYNNWRVGSVGRVRAVFEDGQTLTNPPDGMHHIYTGLADGTPGDYGFGTSMEGGGVNRTLDPVNDARFSRLPGGGFEDPNCRKKEISRVTGKPCRLHAQPGCRIGMYVATQGVIDDGFCRLNYDITQDPSVMLVSVYWPTGQPRFFPLSPFGSYMGIANFMVWGTYTRTSEGHRAPWQIGHIMVATDVRSYNEFLKTIQVGGDEARSRILIVGEDTWLYRRAPLSAYDNRGAMIAVSHGNSSTYVQTFLNDPTVSRGETWEWEQKIRKAVAAQDPLIRAAARHIETNVNGSYGALVDAVTSFNMNSTLASGGWVEDVPGPKHPTNTFYPPTKETLQYINGYREPADKDRPPLPDYAADGEEFFVTVQRLRSRLTGRKPDYDFWSDTGQTEWFLVVAIDREYVLGETDREQARIKGEIRENNERIAAEVDAGAQKVRADIRKSNEEVQDSLEFDRMILYIVVAGSAALLMLLAVLFATAIVAPINKLRYEMAQVATMKLEVVDEERSASSIQEVGAMQVSFIKMVQNLREYRSYMPASVLVDSDGEEEAEEAPDHESTGEDRNPTDPDQGKRASRRSSAGNGQHATALTASPAVVSGASARSSQRQSTLRASHARSEADAAQKAKAATAVGLSKKSAAFMVFNVIDFVNQVKAGGAAVILEKSAQMLTALLEGVRSNKGLPDTFNGDRFYAHWNAVRNVSQCRGAAARAALGLTRALQIEGRSFACGGGDVICGNMGIEGMKKFCCVGAPASFVHRMEQYNEKYRTELLIDSRTKQDVENSMLVRTLAMVKHYKGVDMRIFHVTGEKKMGEDGWMYQLEAAEKADPNRIFSEAMELAFRGETSAAVEMLKADEHRTLQHDLVLAELTAAASCPA